MSAGRQGGDNVIVRGFPSGEPGSRCAARETFPSWNFSGPGSFNR